VNKLRNLLRPTFLVGSLMVALTLATGYAFLTQKPAAAAVDCDTNAVIKCGYTDLANFKAKFAQNTYGDLQKIYGHWGVDGNTFAAQAKHVTVYKSGEVKTDDGTVVATNANSLGREKIGNNRKTVNIAGKDYYYSQPKDSFNPDSLDGYALFNADDHSMMLTILKACGNPVWGTSPGYKCDMLKSTKINDTNYEFVATPYVKNGATVSKIVYDFGDGQTKTVTSNFGQEVTHTYAAGKKFTARATVFFNVNGKEKNDTRQECTKVIETPQPPKPVHVCTGLIAKQVAGSRTKFTFTATAQVKDSTLKSATFKFDDGKTATVNATGTTATTTYEYAKAGNHATTVDLTFTNGTDNGNKNCKVVTTTVPETCKDTPNKPECQTCETTPTKPGCQTCQNTPSLPECQPKTCADTPDKPECKPAEDCTTKPDMDACKEIPSTGPAEVIGSVLGLSTVTGAGVYYRASRRNLLEKLKR